MYHLKKCSILKFVLLFEKYSYEGCMPQKMYSTVNFFKICYIYWGLHAASLQWMYSTADQAYYWVLQVAKNVIERYGPPKMATEDDFIVGLWPPWIVCFSRFFTFLGGFLQPIICCFLVVNSVYLLVSVLSTKIVTESPISYHSI
jgi:hypothetical protein